ncbi:MAG: hypothetical protein AAFR60_09425, partial [Pseudomonadota bacterium]
EVVHQVAQRDVAASLKQCGHRALIADLVQQALSPGSPALERERRVELIGTTPVGRDRRSGFGDRTA